ncbi:MAG: hypothetical protein H0W83_08890 [Planctomycetes bacterium]|nr:hypothetical protein [Planctomycetota bacterium]
MFTLLFFQPAGSPAIALEDLTDGLAAIPGLALDGRTGAAYRPGTWSDAATGARCILDLGTPPLEEDSMHPPRSYAGWMPVPLVVSIPLAGPHWFCVEALRVAEAVMTRFPEVSALDTEDIIADESAEPGPFAWDRLRAIASWERQRAARCDALGNVPRMHRRSSVAMWRYRRERRLGRERHPGSLWPDAMVLSDVSDRSALSAAFFRDSTKPIAIPPVDLLIVARGGEPGGRPAAEVRAAAGGGIPAGFAQASLVQPSAGLDAYLAQASPLPTSAFSALGDEDWTD